MIVGLLGAALVFAALGDWQVHRLAWKQALIARVARATTAPPLAMTALPARSAALFEYRRVALAGRFVPESTTLVTATSELGSGYWDMVVLRHGPAGWWINRGFVPLGSRRAAIAAHTPVTPVTVIGLVRFSEPRGTWLRANRPQADRWYSRDLAALALARHCAAVSTRIFIDAQGEWPQAPAPAPIAGLTVLTFPNNHLGYAITWFTLALLAAVAAGVLVRRRS